MKPAQNRPALPGKRGEHDFTVSLVLLLWGDYYYKADVIVKEGNNFI